MIYVFGHRFEPTHKLTVFLTNMNFGEGCITPDPNINHYFLLEKGAGDRLQQTYTDALVETAEQGKVGKQILFTHSQTIFNRIRVNIKQKNISHEEVIFHYITHSGVETSQVNVNGKFSNNFPRTLFIETMNDLHTLAKRPQKEE